MIALWRSPRKLPLVQLSASLEFETRRLGHWRFPFMANVIGERELAIPLLALVVIVSWERTFWSTEVFLVVVLSERYRANAPDSFEYTDATAETPCIRRCDVTTMLCYSILWSATFS
ncbi:hypothetical protein MRX96_001358 [Rhipicephalus microplus]